MSIPMMNNVEIKYKLDSSWTIIFKLTILQYTYTTQWCGDFIIHTIPKIEQF